MFNGKTHYKWSFSIAMLNYQRVVGNCCWYYVTMSLIWGTTILSGKSLGWPGSEVWDWRWLPATWRTGASFRHGFSMALIEIDALPNLNMGGSLTMANCELVITRWLTYFHNRIDGPGNDRSDLGRWGSTTSTIGSALGLSQKGLA